VTASLLAVVSPAGAVTVWSGPAITFTRPDNVDWTLAENQDRLTANVWIARASSQGIFNSAQESAYTHNLSPAGTEWAFGTAANWQSLTFNNWEQWAGGAPNIPAMVGQDAVLHLIDDDIYLDIKFLSWTGSSLGGGFSYERSTVPEPGSLALLALAIAAVIRGRW
jgi:hypothetical protein